MIRISLPCPKCGKSLEVVEYTYNYSILADGHAVTSCPDCLTALVYRDGRLVEDPPQEDR